MRATSRRSKIIGIAGLFWFLFFGVWAISTFVAPGEKEPGVSWSTRELAIGCGCLFLIGCAGAVLAARRLILPLFSPRQRIGVDAGAPLLSMRVELKYEQFRIYQQHIVPRAMLRAIVIALLFVLGTYYLMSRTRHGSGHVDFQFAGVVAGGLLLSIFIGRPLLLWVASLTWNSSPWLREPRTYEFFEEGILVQGQSRTRAVPWEHVTRAETLGDIISLGISRDWYLFPTWVLPQPEIDQLVTLLKAKVRNCRL